MAADRQTVEPCVTLRVPRWLEGWARDLPSAIADDVEGMALAIEAARRNVAEGSGGPFGALVVDGATGEPLAVGVNLVVAARCSLLHAEIVALIAAQQRCGSHDLSAGGKRMVTLYASAEPCAQCMGAIPWSGVCRLVCAARDADVRAIGFDEGEKPPQWERRFARRGIEVVRDVLRPEAVRVLAGYSAQGGALY